MEPYWRSAGLEPDELAGAYRGAYVTICPPSFLADLPDAPPPRMVPLRPADATPAIRDRDRPLVYVTLGTSFNVIETFRMLLAAVAGVDCDVIMTVGRNRDPRDLEPIPGNVAVEQYIPQAEILPTCDAVISHAGSGTLFATLAHGLPLVLLPQGADQFENAAMGSSLGFGEPVLPGDLTADHVREALVRVLGRAFLRRGSGVDRGRDRGDARGRVGRDGARRSAVAEVMRARECARHLRLACRLARERAEARRSRRARSRSGRALELAAREQQRLAADDRAVLLVDRSAGRSGSPGRARPRAA